MHHQELHGLMQQSAQDAVSYATEQHQTNLDFSLDSLVLVDQILGRLHEDQQVKAHSSELIFTLCNIFGAYVGEVFIRHVGGSWQNNTQDNTAPYLAVNFGDREFPFASVCYHKIVTDNSISLQDYLRQAKENATQ